MRLIVQVKKSFGSSMCQTTNILVKIDQDNNLQKESVDVEIELRQTVWMRGLRSAKPCRYVQKVQDLPKSGYMSGDGWDLQEAVDVCQEMILIGSARICGCM